MQTYRFDVVIVGAGPAGVTAAGVLAGSGISVCLLEAGAYAGAENWSGCVYFAESLALPECFGPAALQEAPYERQVTRRGTIMHNGIDEVGVSLDDPALFRHCYTVLRPVFDPYAARLAAAKGAVLLTDTTVTSLIRKNGAVIGVDTPRGPLYAGVVFIAEGDASHLVRAEDLERTDRPHFLQGVKAVLNLPPQEIERRFGLASGQGAAYEYLIRNGSLGGRTASLNMGGFLYTNRDSLSLGFVAPLDNLTRHYRGDHAALFSWLQGLPGIRDLVRDASLSAYGAKLIRSGGWRERPVLAGDGFAVGGASANLGVDIPFPNFTGPASATGLFFGRAVKQLLRDGRTPDRKNLREAYVEPLEASVYGRNARHLAAWPGYFGRSRVLFGRTVDLACGGARFLATERLSESGRYLRTVLFSPRAMRELAGDTAAAFSSLGLWRPLLATVVHPGTWASWLRNSFRGAPQPDPRLTFVLRVDGRMLDVSRLPRPLGGLARRILPALGRALSLVYANDDVPASRKLAGALRAVIRAFRLQDLAALPAFGAMLGGLSLAAALKDAFRYYVLKTPAEQMLAGPAMAYGLRLRSVRDLDAVRPAMSIEARLATNTYRVGTIPHIRTLWPSAVGDHEKLGSSGIWSVCPARVYTYDAPLAGRGRVGVNWENCIKCESCWRAEPGDVLWGRFTDHQLIYRPRTAMLSRLLAAPVLRGEQAPHPAIIDKKLWYAGPLVVGAARDALRAAAAFRDAAAGLPPSVDHGRGTWPLLLGRRFCDLLADLEKLLLADGRRDTAGDLAFERSAVAGRLDQGRLVPARYAAARIEHRLAVWMPELLPAETPAGRAAERDADLAKEAGRTFPDRMVKQWENDRVPGDWAERLLGFIREHGDPSVRALASVSPALGLIAAGHLRADAILGAEGKAPVPGLCAVDGNGLSVAPAAGGSAALKGAVHLVPAAAATGLLMIIEGRGYLVPVDAPGVTVSPTPAIGLRAAGLCDVHLDCTVPGDRIISAPPAVDGAPAFYLGVALGAGDYLARRAREHAAGRVQFGGLMLDTEGRDGIAKLGSVKALVARVESWRLLLETLYDLDPRLSPDAVRVLGLVRSAAAALAFGPENGCMAYDAGQVFGGFAYSEDDLLSRSYRDSSLFRFLAPGHGAAARLQRELAGKDLARELAQELGPLDRVRETPLGPLLRRWKELCGTWSALPKEAEGGMSGEAAALLLSLRGLFARIESGLASGRSSEAEAACLEVLLGLADDALMKAALSAGRGTVPAAAVFPSAPDRPLTPLDLSYETFCEHSAPAYRSGSFLLSAFDRSPRYVPEMQLHDPALRPLWDELVAWFRKNCRDRTWDGLPFERHVERLHDLPPDVIEAVRANRWLATYVPRSVDGLGWRKAAYYVLNSAAGSYGDAAVCLLIMASTSIGTTPILLGLEEELPRVREELEPLVRDPKLLGEIGSRIDRIVASFRSPDPARIRKDYEAVMRLVDDRIRRTRVVKYLASNFLRAFYGAGIAGRRGDFGGFRDQLTRAAGLFTRLMPDVRSALDELPRRERCHKLHLRTLGHGAVSAFALTEPTAGSDSGGVRTTAQLRRAMLSPMPDGRYGFSPTGEPDKCLRYLIDADRVAFTPGGMAYRTPDDAPALIRIEGDPAVRSYEYQGGRCVFHDIGQVRQTDAGPAYEYYTLTGAKMWITNGSIATQFCLFAQAAEGVTGFIVDRHAEGLKVGADERKMGQRGSPTNELALDGVRVPREAVIGYEGHGQVNALETLNVGRCGLAVVAGAIVRKVMEEVRASVPPTPERDLLLGEAAAVQFGSESLAYHLIGLFDRPHESVRMESAIAKYVCSEDLHEVLSLLEQAGGPTTQTERHLLEKARRDARILNIYEGTNEVQRFLILKDLIALAGTWPEARPERPGDEAAAALALWKDRLRGHVRAAAAELGDHAWQDAMLQPALFRLAEMAGEVLRLECIWYRMEWLCSRAARLGREYTDPLAAAGKRAAERALARLAHLDRRYTMSAGQLARGFENAEVRAADAALDRAGTGEEQRQVTPGGASGQLRILALIRPAAELSPAPTLRDGGIEELLWRAEPGDRAALEQALSLRASGIGAVTLHVLLVGGPEREDILRGLAPDADRVLRLDRRETEPRAAADAVRDLEQEGRYDLIVLGASALAGSDPVAPFIAGRLGRPYLRRQELATGELPLPCVIGVTGGAPAARPPLSRAVDAAFRTIEVVLPRNGERSRHRFSLPAQAATRSQVITTAAGAADLLRAFASASKQARPAAYTEPVAAGPLPNDAAIWVVLDPAGGRMNEALLRAGRMAADLFGRPRFALVPAPRSAWPELLGLARDNGAGQACCIDTGEGTLSGPGMLEVLGRIMKASGSSMVFAPAPWADAAGTAAGRQGDLPVLSGITGIEKTPEGELLISRPAYDGRLVRQDLVPDGAAVLVFESAPDLPAAPAGSSFGARELIDALPRDGTVPRPPAAAPSLERAEVIIDLGYGIRDRAGLDLAGELKRKLEEIGLAPLFGATRKVTQDLKLQPIEAQIGQTGVRVDPKIVIALGISGAPQHVDWLGSRAEVLCFNKDPDAPLMKLNQTRPAPRVHPIPGDLFATVRELIRKLG